MSGFTGLAELQGKEVTVTGIIEMYNGKPQIALSSPSQITGSESSTATPSATLPANPAVENPAGTLFRPAPASSMYRGSGFLAGLAPGSVFTFQAPLPPKAQRLAKAGGNPGAEMATVGVGVPADFTPAKKWPVLVVFTTSDGDFSHVNRLNAFVRTANACGWVVLAADGPAKPPRINTEWCWAMLSTGLDVLEKEWPGFKQWPMACGGNSGGAKMSALMAAQMAAEGLSIAGVFMSGCNEDLLSVGLREFRPPATFKKTAVFLSSGTRDQTAPPGKAAAVAASMKGAGFRNVRLESHQGGHLMDDNQVAMALEWFASSKGE